MATKQSSGELSTLASKVLSGKTKPTPAQSRKLAASVLSQDETKGQRKYRNLARRTKLRLAFSGNLSLLRGYGDSNRNTLNNNKWCRSPPYHHPWA